MVEQYRYPKSTRLLTHRDFQEVRRKGKECFGDWLRLRYMPAPSPKLGVVISRKAGNAVLRNRCKRILREFYRLHRSEWPSGYWLISPKASLIGCSPQELRAEFESLVARCVGVVMDIV